MYYELYIDVLFLVNFMMDSLLLLTLKWMLKCPATHRRVFLGSAIGAVITCIVIVIPAAGIIKLILFHTAVNTIMIKTGLKVNGKLFWKAFILLYMTSFLFGGILQVFYPYVKTGSVFYAAAVVSYYLIKQLWIFLVRIRDTQKRICEITLYSSRGERKIKALIDTGNALLDRWSKEPVSVVDKALAKSILTDAEMKNGFHYIPYRTVGKESVMPVFRIQKMCIHLEQERWIDNPVIGVGAERVSEQDEYQMILNPDLLGGI